MNKLDVAQTIVDIQTILEIAKDNWLEDNQEDALKLLRQARQDMRTLTWRIWGVNVDVE